MSSRAFVSIGLPVRNGAAHLDSVARSVLAQGHARLELVITDNASTDATEEIGRALAREDPRVRYHRQPRDMGLLNNFRTAIGLARGTFFRWIGDEDTLAPNYVSRCLEVFAADPRLVLVTSQTGYLGDDGVVRTAQYTGTGLR